jgi:hypothetical protein
MCRQVMRTTRGAAILMMLASGLQATIVDRVAIAVGNKVITQSEIEERIRLTAFQNGEKPDFSPASRKQAAERLIDQKLIEREMDVGHFPRADAERGKQLLADYEASSYPADSPASHAGMMNALAADGLTADDLETDLMRQADLLTFLDLRFKPAVQVDDTEVRKYFEEKVPPGPAKEQQGLGGMRPQIELILATEQADKDLDEWLKDQRLRLKIEYVDKDLK